MSRDISSMAQSRSMSQTLARAMVHVIVGVVCANTVWLLPRTTAETFLAAVTVVFLILEFLRLRNHRWYPYFSGLFNPFVRIKESGTLSGASYLLLGSLLTALLFPKSIAVLAILFLAFGDPAATLIGTWKGRIKFWGKSIEGNVACLSVCLLIGILMTRVQAPPSLTVAMFGALAASVLQTLPLKLNDNITIPVGSALAMLALGAII